MPTLGDFLHALGNDKPGEVVSDIVPVNRNAGPQAGLSLNPFNSEPGVAHPGLPEVVRSLIRGLGNISDGPQAMLTPQNTLNADTLGTITALGGGAGLAAPELKAGESLSGVFAGRKAATADTAKLGKAMSLEGRGAPAEDIHDATKWFRGSDGQWRFEIPDEAGALKLPVDDNGYQSVPPSGITKQDPPLLLSEILDHPELYEAYPKLAGTIVKPAPSLSRSKGSYSLRNKDITLGSGSVPDIHSTAHHEIQHAIQDLEGFSGGGDPNIFIPPDIQRLLQLWKGLGANEDKIKAIDSMAMSMYQRLAGEAEARNVQSRIGGKHMQVDDTPSWSMAETSVHDPAEAKYPWKTLDVTPDQHLLWANEGPHQYLIYPDGTPVPRLDDSIAQIIGGLNGR